MRWRMCGPDTFEIVCAAERSSWHIHRNFREIVWYTSGLDSCFWIARYDVHCTILALSCFSRTGSKFQCWNSHSFSASLPFPHNRRIPVHTPPVAKRVDTYSPWRTFVPDEMLKILFSILTYLRPRLRRVKKGNPLRVGEERSYLVSELTGALENFGRLRCSICRWSMTTGSSITIFIWEISQTPPTHAHRLWQRLS